MILQPGSLRIERYAVIEVSLPASVAWRWSKPIIESLLGSAVCFPLSRSREGHGQISLKSMLHVVTPKQFSIPNRQLLAYAYNAASSMLNKQPCPWHPSQPVLPHNGPRQIAPSDLGTHN